jgi:hypothetical protein
MPAHTRRRSFAAPLVLTVAGACGGKGPPPNVNPPRPEPPQASEWTVYKQDGACFAVDSSVCPPPADDSVAFSCAAPTTAYDCPELLSLDRPIVVVRVDPTSCEMKMEMGDCPEGASCNPPPPQPMKCPQ